MASGNDNVERIKFEAKKELVRSIKGLQSSVEKSCGNISHCGARIDCLKKNCNGVKVVHNLSEKPSQAPISITKALKQKVKIILIIGPHYFLAV